jgi:NAD(P)-dependent dehydrogenase (short-subunit alcohol dehydrogenase family)
MDFDRINPVALISGATHGAGAACAQPIAYGAEGGLILIDRDAAALDALADKLGEEGVAPERVSMLTHEDAEDPHWWERVGAFIKDHYGRLDWAVINACAPQADDGALVDFRRDGGPHMQAASLALRTALPLMRFNNQGGAIVVIAPAAALKADPGLLQLIRAAAKDSAGDNIRVNAIALGQAPGAIQSFEDIARDTGSERAAFEIIANLTPPLARYPSSGDLNRLVLSLLTDVAPVTGTTLVVDGGYTL